MKKVIIIGSGPGGYFAALRLTHSACKPVIIEKSFIGGTCLNIGCIPTKSLLDHLSLYEHFVESSKVRKIFIQNGADVKINPENLRLYQIEVIRQLQGSLEKLFKKNEIKFIRGEARLLSANKVLIKTSQGELIEEADEIVIATGSSPRTVPGFVFDKKLIVSSDDVWNIPYIPRKLLIIGSGPIGIEFARVFHALGSEITITEIRENICPILDLELSENLTRSLKKRGIKLKPNVASKFIEKKDNLVLVEFISTIDITRNEKAEFDQVLIAVGRKPNINNLGLEEVGVELEANTFIKVNEYLQSSIGTIWAIGDVTNYPQLAHTASFQARILAENILGAKKVFKGDLIPSCIFGYPEVAFVGEAEVSLKEKNIDYKIGKCFFLANPKAKASGLTEGLVKLLMETNSKKILGAHIIGPEASNLIHELVVAMQNDLTVDKIVQSIHAHPTYSEIILEALENCIGEAIHV